MKGTPNGLGQYDFLQRLSNDFPHGNSSWPNSRHIVAGDLGELPAALRAKLVRENVQSFTTFQFQSRFNKNQKRTATGTELADRMAMLAVATPARIFRRARISIFPLIQSQFFFHTLHDLTQDRL
jgi:hypothetical protein